MKSRILDSFPGIDVTETSRTPFSLAANDNIRWPDPSQSKSEDLDAVYGENAFELPTSSHEFAGRILQRQGKFFFAVNFSKL